MRMTLCALLALLACSFVAVANHGECRFRPLDASALSRPVGQQWLEHKVCTLPDAWGCDWCGPLHDYWANCTLVEAIGSCTDAFFYECYLWQENNCGFMRKCTFGSPGGACSQCVLTDIPCDFPGCSL
jgi:hypothetical protein